MRRLTAALAALSLAASLTAAQTPADRCHSAGYSDAVHILQPDGQTRRWLCFTLPSDDLKTPYRAAYLSDLTA